jgi:hypothetical protein
MRFLRLMLKTGIKACTDNVKYYYNKDERLAFLSAMKGKVNRYFIRGKILGQASQLSI